MADKETTEDTGIGLFWLTLVAIALGFLIWWLYEEELKNLVRWIRYGQMWPASFFLEPDYTVQYGEFTINFREWFTLLPDIPSPNLNGQSLGIISALALKPYKWVVIGILVIMGYFVYKKNPKQFYRTAYDLDGFIRRQANIFPVISPFVDFNPAEMEPRPPGMPVPAEMPVFGEALGPEEWIAYHTIPVPDGRIDRAAARQAFEKQLGLRWKGAKNLAPYKQILLASFCLKASRKRDEADEMLSRLSLCWTEKKGLRLQKDKKLLKEARKVLKTKDLAASVLSQCNRHAFETTAMLRGLFVARQEGGVLAPAQFLWLRGHDRNLWYPLNNLGRESYHMEALGAMAHYISEKRADRPIPKPKVEDAVQGLYDYMESNNARPIPKLDYSKSKKRGIKKVKA